jgi:hypothetical protein
VPSGVTRNDYSPDSLLCRGRKRTRGARPSSCEYENSFSKSNVRRSKIPSVDTMYGFFSVHFRTLLTFLMKSGPKQKTRVRDQRIASAFMDGPMKRRHRICCAFRKCCATRQNYFVESFPEKKKGKSLLNQILRRVRFSPRRVKNEFNVEMFLK